MNADSATTSSSPQLEEVGRGLGFSADAVREMLRAVRTGHGTMAQFSHPEFGGSGQWMQGGMTMVSDMFDTDMVARVNALCSALVQLPPSALPAANRGVDASRPSRWWPESMGVPDTAGAQDHVRYAYFRSANRLLIDDQGHITTYDTGPHHITGVSQQQSGGYSLTFATDAGPLDVARLRKL